MSSVSTFLMKWVVLTSATFGMWTCLSTLGQTLSEAFLPAPLLLCRLLTTVFGASQFVCSLMIYFKLQQNSKLLGTYFYLFTTTAFCATVNYIIYINLKRKYRSEDKDDMSYYLELNVIDTCMAANFAIFLLFHLIVIFDCDSHKDNSNSSGCDKDNSTRKPKVPFQIFTIETHGEKC